MTVSALLVLQARAEARAFLYEVGEFDLDEAVAPLMRYARECGIAEPIGAAIVKAAFAGVGAEL